MGLASPVFESKGSEDPSPYFVLPGEWSEGRVIVLFSCSHFPWNELSFLRTAFWAWRVALEHLEVRYTSELQELNSVPHFPHSQTAGRHE
eukprot:548977-Amphidinium_carterae.1